MKRYIPEKVLSRIKQLDYKTPDHLYVICDMIYRVSIFKKVESNEYNSFIDIPINYFRDIIPKSTSFYPAMDFLKSNEIIICDNNYSKLQGKALGYKFNDNLISKLIPVEIKSKSIGKRIINNKNSRNSLVDDSLKMYKDYFLKTFKIDYVSALGFIDNWFKIQESSPGIYLDPSYVGPFLDKEWIKLVNKYNQYFMSISSINDGDLFFRKNKTNGRVDTNLTNLKSELKQFIIGDNLFQLDIRNSQPFILSLYLNRIQNLEKIDSKELSKYSDWTSSGMFYYLFEKEYHMKMGKSITNKEIKTMIFCIFYSKTGSYQKEKSIFKCIFPSIFNFIEGEKKMKHNEFAIKMQKIESKICIDIICKELDKEGIKYYTIHDAWIVGGQDVEKTEKIVYKMFYKHLNRRPTLKIEKLNDINIYY